MKKKTLFLFLFILAVGILPRIWAFGQLPAGLHQDEAANGVDSYDVLHYRMDRTGILYPIQFVSWGSGQSALYGYAAMPFIAIWGLNPTTIRLPNLIAGILILPLAYLAGRKIQNQKFGLIVLSLVAISPWNIMGARWGLEAYFVPFLFLAGFTCYLYSEMDNYWFAAGSLIFGLSIYAYSTTFAVVPIFFILAVIFLWKAKKLAWKSLVIGTLLLTLVALPMIAFILINTFDLPAFRIYKFTVPRLPTEPRYITTVSIFHQDGISRILSNLQTMLSVLWHQQDGLIWNSVEPFGFLYPFALIPCLLGLAWGVTDYRNNRNPAYLMVLSWFLAALTIGILQPANIHRLSLLFLPMTLMMAFLFYQVSQISRNGALGIALLYLTGFIWFNMAYFNREGYQQRIAQSANYGILSALQYTRDYPTYQVCLSEKMVENYIHILMVEKPDPLTYLKNPGYIDVDTPFTKSSPLDRYAVNLNDCKTEGNRFYILPHKDSPPADITSVAPQQFDWVDVYQVDR